MRVLLYLCIVTVYGNFRDPRFFQLIDILREDLYFIRPWYIIFEF